MNQSESRRISRRLQNQKNLRARYQNHRGTNREKSTWLPQARKKLQPQFPTQDWQTKSRKRRQTLLQKKKNRRRQSQKQKQQKKSRPATIANRKTHKNPRVLVKESWQKNLTTKQRRRQGRRRVKRPSPALLQNQNGTTRPRPNRNPRRRNPRRFRAKQKTRGNPNRREKKRQHKSRKTRRPPLRNSVLGRKNGRVRRRERRVPNKKFHVLQAASERRL